MRSREDLGLALRDPLPWATFAGLARSAESMGYGALFLPEIAGRDAFAALTGLAGETDRLRLGTGIVPMTSRIPRVTAMGATTVQERSGGRMILGVGTGAPRAGALASLEEHVRALRFLLSGEGLSLRPATPVPIWIAALGPRALDLAGRIADGVILNWCTPERVAQARSALRASAERVGRDAGDVTIAVYVRAAMGDGAGAQEALRGAFDEYAVYPAYARQFAAMGVPTDPEAAVERLCLAGDEHVARARLLTFREAGADLPVVYPVAFADDPEGSIGTTLRALAPRA